MTKHDTSFRSAVRWNETGVNEAFGMMHADENTDSNSNRVGLRHDRSANDAREPDLMERKAALSIGIPDSELLVRSIT